MLESAVGMTTIQGTESAVETSSIPDTEFADLCCVPVTERRLSAKFSAHGPAVVSRYPLSAIVCSNNNCDGHSSRCQNTSPEPRNSALACALPVVLHYWEYTL